MTGVARPAATPIGHHPQTDIGLAPARRGFSREAVLAAVLGYLLLLPPQFIFDFGGFVFPPHRLFLLAAFFLVVGKVDKLRERVTIIDALVVFACGWIFLALTVSSGFARAINGGGAQFVDIGLAYLFARIAFSNLRDLRIFLILLAPGLALAGVLIAAESILHVHIVQPLAGALIGRPVELQVLASDIRLGLLRAAGPFPHPILAGMFLGTFLPLYMLSGIRGWPRLAGTLAALCSFFSVSSAAILALAAGGALMTYNWLVERIANLSWRLFFAGAAMVVVALQLTSNSGAIVLITRFASLNEWTGYYRRLIWRFGTASVEQHPLFGIGYSDWERLPWMSNSVDNFWLLLAMQYGLVPPLALLAAAIFAVIAASRASSRFAQLDARLLRGLAMTLAVATLGAFSVSLWLSVQVWFFMLLGMTISLAHPLARSVAALTANR